MPRPKRYTATPDAADPNGITTSVSPTGAQELEINGALATVAYDRNGILAGAQWTAGTLSLATLGAAGRSFAAATRIVIWGASDESGKNFTIHGLDAAGTQIIKETIAGPNNANVQTTKTFTSVEKITLDTTTTGNDVEVGVIGAVVFATPQKVATNVTTSTSDSVVITGTDRYGAAMTETIACVDATSTQSTKDFKTINRVQADGAMTAVIVGVDGMFASQWFAVDRYASEFNIGISIDDSTTGTFQVESTGDDTSASDFDESTAQAAAIGDSALADVTADAVGSTTAPVSAIRLRASAAVTGTVGMDIIQVG